MKEPWIIHVLDFVAGWIIISACAYQSMSAAWRGDYRRILHICEVLAAFIAAIVGAHIMGQHLWAG